MKLDSNDYTKKYLFLYVLNLSVVSYKYKVLIIKSQLLYFKFQVEKLSFGTYLS